MQEFIDAINELFEKAKNLNRAKNDLFTGL